MKSETIYYRVLLSIFLGKLDRKVNLSRRIFFNDTVSLFLICLTIIINKNSDYKGEDSKYVFINQLFNNH